MSIKIQINSLEALERLIGGDSQVEIDIRQSIVQEFAKKHLKAVASNEIIKRAETALIDVVCSEFMTKVNSYNYTFNEKTKEKLRDQVETSVREQMQTVVDREVKELASLKALNERLEFAAKYVTDQLTEKYLEKRLEIMVNKRIKEKLGVE